MATKTQNVEEVIANLLNLQTVDTQLDEIKILKGELPMEVSDLDDEIQGLSKRIEKLKKGVEDVEAEVLNHKTNIKDSTALIEKYEKQLDDVKNNREFEALTKEIELQKLEIQLSEKKIGDTDHIITTKKEAYSSADTRLTEKKKELEVKQVELEKIVKKTEKEERKLVKASNAARESLDDRLLKSYDRIRTNFRNGLAVVGISRDSCGGCHYRIPPQLKIEVAQRKQLITCENCGRVLVHKESEVEE